MNAISGVSFGECTKYLLPTIKFALQIYTDTCILSLKINRIELFYILKNPVERNQLLLLEKSHVFEGVKMYAAKKLY